MLKVQRYSSIFTPGAWAGTRKQVDAVGVAVLPRGGVAKTMTWEATCMPVVRYIFSPRISQPGSPSLSCRTAVVSMKVASEPWFGSVRPKPARSCPAKSFLGVAVVLGVGGELLEHQDEGVVADDGVLVLQVVVQAQPLGGQVLADHRQFQLRPALAAKFFGPAEAQMAGGVGAFAGLAQQGLPFLLRQAAGLPVGAFVLAPMVEVFDVVVLLLQRLDLRLDEGVEFGQIGDEVGGQIEVHGVGP